MIFNNLPFCFIIDVYNANIIFKTFSGNERGEHYGFILSERVFSILLELFKLLHYFLELDLGTFYSAYIHHKDQYKLIQDYLILELVYGLLLMY
mmetsp:Transcript_32681/g.28941  ORF Transcript_32681/g.28941 Transcript_32681/m.28941 type:complete len:94 (-) Transcript_32681:85-366(-)